MFEFNPDKSAMNSIKHGIDFLEAQALWSGSFTETQLPYHRENRSLVVGRIKEKFWSAIITNRHESIRIISVRRSREKEIKI